ncbi:MAG: glycosyltransferase [Gammaproteobacteria bacterium]|nr:glycosyltransferase [Gammaproteobacteria bacterium]
MPELDKNLSAVEVSVVIPVYNEEAVLPALFTRLYAALDKLGRSYEIIFIDDGSHDKSRALLRQQFQTRPDVTRVVYLKMNAGQHMALIAGFEHARGRRVVTLDSDLQNPPEEIGNLLAKMDEGFDYVGSIRRKRNDSLWRHLASRLMNRIRERITHIHITDQGCMLRAYDRDIIQAMLSSREVTTFIPALAFVYAANPTEIVVEHEERAAGESKYSLYKLTRLNFDLVTSFSLVPLQMFSLIGIVVSIISFLFVLYLALRRLIVGPEVEGVFTLFAIAFFVMGLLLFGIGLLGEYLGRLYLQVRERPRYLVHSVLEADTETKHA